MALLVACQSQVMLTSVRIGLENRLESLLGGEKIYFLPESSDTIALIST